MSRRRQPERTTAAPGVPEAATPTGPDPDADAAPAERAPTAAERAFAAAWAAAVSDTSYVPLDRAEVEAYLAGLTARLATLLSAEPFCADPAAEVGREMIDTHFTGPGTLGRTVEVLTSRLLDDLGLAETPELRARLAALQGALATGYATSARLRTLAEQEAIRQAVLDARNDAERALRNSEARFRAVFADAAVGIGITDLDGRLVDVNQALAEMLGHQVGGLAGSYVADLVHPDDVSGVLLACTALVAGDREYVRTEKRFYRRDGVVVWAHLAISVIRDEDGVPRYQVFMLEDVTDRHLLHARLRHEALHDPLTGLPNRALFFDRLTEAFGTAGPADRIGLCYLDLDGFKVVNDSLGHDVGDQLLVAVGRRLDERVSGAGRLVARMGGDEFVILVENLNGVDSAVGLADGVLAALSAPIRIGGHELTISASIGIVEADVATTTPADAMQAADITLYWAKSEGKGRWALFDPDRNAHEVARYTLSAAMPAALDRDEFFVEYQPLVRLPDGERLGVEALVRWKHPKFGVLGPTRFIELAEETGLIVPLGRKVLAEACRAWQEAAPDGDTFVSVNLAVRQSRDPGLVSDVRKILEQTGLRPDRLLLELTESAVMGTDDEPLRALRELSAMGVRIAIDDFGTGYSNLAYLRHLPVHALKIAGSFVEGLRAEVPDRVDEQIVRTLVTLAHTLGHTVIAEGVETELQAERLHALGCDAAQGWYFGRPGALPDA
jgi:diguanylate cyclase (GGDEF)-like protein/PAS domain S-box-containing protein